ncbi:MAG: PDZ domain-containing protein [Akkermansia sp.]|nr:PDZ domain-containing protein [Akkermansia sp.]MBR2313509.1 PDZ domain-containing protein [Akkermansia sp.]
MIRTLSLLTLVAFVISGCKPTERTALKKKNRPEQSAPAQPEQPQPAPEPAPAPAPAEPAPAPQPGVATPPPPAAPEPAPAEPAPAPQPEVVPQAPAEPQPAPEPEPAPQPEEPADSLLLVSATLQEYNPMRPWEKDTPRQSQALGVFMGEGRVLTVGRVVRSATYVELMLPDASRTVPARVLRYDDDLNLALLTVAHDEDAAIFETRTALPLGEPLNRGDKAICAGLINGVEPVHVSLQAENVAGDNVPLMVMRAERPLQEGQAGGAPVVRDGRLSALGTSYRKQDMLLQVVNAELIQRFLTQDGAGVPVMGVQLTPLDDPLFRKYLKLDAAANGLYISKVLPGSAAEAAGIRAGDVLTAVDGLPVDNQGRCNHPRYGLHAAAVLLRGMKDRGQQMPITVSRGGETLQLSVALNRDAVENALIRPQKPGAQPRYIMWGGMLFQPLTSTYLNELRNRSNGLLPLELQMLEQNQDELRKSGCSELVGLTFVLPTAATQGYDDLRFCRLIAVNGRPVNSFKELPALLDESTDNGIIRLEFNKAPYTVYVERSAIDAVNSHLREQAIPILRVVE